MLLKVTQEMIDRRIRGRRGIYCPVGQALNSVLKKGYYAVAGIRLIAIKNVGDSYDDESGIWTVSTPDVLSAAMTKVDRKNGIEPFEFELDIPKEYLDESRTVAVS